MIPTDHCFLNVLATKIEPMHCLAYFHYHFVDVHSVDSCCSVPQSFGLDPFATFAGVVVAGVLQLSSVIVILLLLSIALINRIRRDSTICIVTILLLLDSIAGFAVQAGFLASDTVVFDAVVDLAESS